jgi:hypothetical protein
LQFALDGIFRVRKEGTHRPLGNESAHFCASVPVGHPLAFRTALQSPEIKRMQNHAQREDFKRSVAVGLSQASCGVYVDASEPGSSIQVLGSFSSSALPVGSSYDHLITCDRHLTRTVAPRPRALPPLRGGALRARPPADSEAAAGNIQVRRVCPPMHCRSGTGFT